jgi:hypothetical protein
MSLSRLLLFFGLKIQKTKNLALKVSLAEREKQAAT